MGREEGGMWLGRVESNMHQSEGFTLQLTALPSTPFSPISLSAFSFLTKNQPTNSSLSPCSQFSHSPQLFTTPSHQHADLSLSQTPDSLGNNTYQLCIPQFLP